MFNSFQISSASRTTILLLSIACLTTTVSAEKNPLYPLLEWRTLDRFQESLTESDFRDRLKIFSPDGSINEFLTFHDDHSVTVFETPAKEIAIWTLRFYREPDSSPPSHRTDKFSPQHIATLFDVSYAKPLKGLTIAIDPGHIGGAWANIEERHFKYKSYPPVQEGDLTLITAEHLATALKSAGATVILTRTEAEPVTTLRPQDFLHDSLEWAADTTRGFSDRYFTFRYKWYSQFLFYRVAEIAARAQLLAKYQPDFTLCLHYNAAPWSGRRPRLFNVQKLVTFVHGSYLKEEIESPTQKFELFKKLFENSTPIEIEIADVVSSKMAERLQMKPENYTDWKAADRVSENPYIWSRNVIANREIPGPVIFLEGLYMNDRESFYRIQAGDYEGLKTIRGKSHPSVFREFAQATADGIIEHYREKYDLTAPPEASLPTLPEDETATPDQVTSQS
jgi:N-acetylmuramoyl-L-alanine amidase